METTSVNLSVRKGWETTLQVHRTGRSTNTWLRPGFVLERIDGQHVDDLVDAAFVGPPFHERGERAAAIDAVRDALYGEPGRTITVDYRDGDDSARQATLTLVERTAMSQTVDGLPEGYTEMELGRLEGDIGYLRFNGFLSTLRQPLLDAVDELGDTDGLIIDLRGVNLRFVVLQ